MLVNDCRSFILNFDRKKKRFRWNVQISAIFHILTMNKNLVKNWLWSKSAIKGYAESVVIHLRIWWRERSYDANWSEPKYVKKWTDDGIYLDSSTSTKCIVNDAQEIKHITEIIILVSDMANRNTSKKTEYACITIRSIMHGLMIKTLIVSVETLFRGIYVHLHE